MNETQLWYCDTCDKTSIIKSKSERILKHINTNKNVVLLSKNMNLLNRILMK